MVQPKLKFMKVWFFKDKLIIGRPLIFLYRFLYSFNFIIKKKILLFKNRLKYGKLYFNKEHWANPKKIQLIYKIEKNYWNDYLRILDGDWDQLVKQFENSIFHQGYKQRFIDGKKWEDTEFYHIYSNYIKKGILRKDPKNLEEFNNVLRKRDLLYSRIIKYGFKSKKELTSYKGFFKKLYLHKILDNIFIYIGRDGDVLVQHGKHRLSMAKILELPKVPITIFGRHKKWMEFRTHLISFSKKYRVGPLNQILTHPDLQSIPFKKDNSYFDLIIKNISVTHGKVLDIGAKFGYFCHILENKGFDCYAIEENRDYAFFLRKLKKLEEKKFKIITETIFDYNKDQYLFFDVVLALNRFHGFLKTRESYLNLIKFLKRLKIKELFFGAYNPRKFRNQNFYRNYSSEQFVNFIIEHSCLNKAEFIGKTKDGRKLYKFTSVK